MHLQLWLPIAQRLLITSPVLQNIDQRPRKPFRKTESRLATAALGQPRADDPSQGVSGLPPIRRRTLQPAQGFTGGCGDNAAHGHDQEEDAR